MQKRAARTPLADGVTSARPASLGRVSLPHAIRQRRAIGMRPDLRPRLLSEANLLRACAAASPLCGIGGVMLQWASLASAPCSPLGARFRSRVVRQTLGRLPRALEGARGITEARERKSVGGS